MPNKIEPRVRASHLKEDLEAVAKLGPDAAAQIRARLSPASLAGLAEAARSAWLPVDLNLEMAEAVHAVAGEAGLRVWGRESCLSSMSALFRPLIQAATAIFDPTPTAICRFAPRAWSATYLEAGKLEIQDVEDDRLKVALVDFPEPFRRRAFLAAVAGTFEATFVYCDYSGAVEIDAPRGTQDPALVLRWTRGKAGAQRPAGG